MLGKKFYDVSAVISLCQNPFVQYTRSHEFSIFYASQIWLQKGTLLGESSFILLIIWIVGSTPFWSTTLWYVQV